MVKRKPSETNLLLAVDKPVGITSHDAVALVRRALNERRVGHAGTLDPLASGVMVIGVGQATRLLGRITLDRKSYLARIAFGYETNTDDAEGEVTRTIAPAPELSNPDFASHVLAGFLGLQEQVPPAFSAISVDGVRSYRRARAGEEVELPARPIEVYAADLIGVEPACDVSGPVWTVSFTVSKGTYIRSLARDIGRAAQAAAHIADLRRTSSGNISLRMCIGLDVLDRTVARARCLDPVAVLGLPALDLTDDALADVLVGRSVSLSSLAPHAGTPCAVGETGANASAPVALVHGGELRAIAVTDGARVRMQDVFPQGIGGVL